MKAKFLSMLICTAKTGFPGAEINPELTIFSLKTSIIRSSEIPKGMFPMYSRLAWRVIWLAAGWGGGGMGRGAVASPKAGGGAPTVGTWPAAVYVCMYVCMHVCMYVCMYVCICV